MKNDVELPKYLSIFKENDCDDITSLDDFTSDTLKNDLNITNTIHRNKILRYCEIYKKQIRQFNLFLKNNKLGIYEQIFDKFNIYILKDLKNILLNNPNIFSNEYNNYFIKEKHLAT